MNVREPRLDEVVQAVRQWPPQMRISLACAILQTVDSSELQGPGSGGPHRGRPVEELIGLGAGSGEPPSHEVVKQWIDEHRMGKFGR